MIRFIFKIFIILFAVLTVLTALLTNTARRSALSELAAIEHAVELNFSRLPQARELFTELRPDLDILSGSDELYAREVLFVPRLLLTSGEEIIWRAQWELVYWLTPDELQAVETLLFNDIEGARDRSIAFSEDAMSVTIFAAPFHSLTGVNAWLAFSYKDCVLIFPDHHVVYTENLDDSWYLTIYAEIPQINVVPFLVVMFVFFAVTLILLGILIWGSKTKRFL